MLFIHHRKVFIHFMVGNRDKRIVVVNRGGQITV